MSEVKRGRGRPRKSEAEKLAAAEAKARAKAEAAALETPAMASPRPGRDLVDCPFCGSEKCEIRERGRQQFVPRCFACDARLGLFSSAALARQAWNTRVGGMVPVPVVEAAPEAVPARLEAENNTREAVAVGERPIETDAPASVPEAAASCPLVEALATMVVLSDLFSDPPPEPIPAPRSIDLNNRNAVVERAPGVFEVLTPGSADLTLSIFDPGF